MFWQIGFCLYLFFRQVFGTQMWLSDLYYHICYQGYNLFGDEIKCVVEGWWWSLFYNGGIRILILDHMLPKSLILVRRTASVIGDMRPPTVCIFWVFLSWFGQSLCEWASPHTTLFCFLVQVCALCPKPWHLKHCWIEGVILNFSTLKIMPIFWHISPLEISVSACFGSSHFIFIKGRSLPVLFDFILSASAWEILLKSSSSLKSSSVMLLDTPLKTKTFPVFASAEWYDLGSDILTFFPKTCCIFSSLCRMAKSLGVSPMKIQPFLSAWFVKLWGLDGTASVRSWS